MTTTYDVIVAGAGPAGSTAARILARSGVRVLMLDRADFPRDKPCGGGITFRADTASGIDLSPVTEREIYGVRVSADLGNPFERRSSHLLARMTQRSRLDDFLAQAAAEAGADFRDGHAIRQITDDDGTVTVRTERGIHTGRILIGADGVNGIVARTLDMQPAGEHAVAFEANYPASGALARRWDSMIALDLGGIPGGYGWVFPKGDHLNVGVGGWKATGPTLRDRLDRYARFLGLNPVRLEDHRGYQLPLRRDGQPVVRRHAMLVGDAAALVDPLSGEGIWAAFVSGRLAAEEAQRFLSGEVNDIGGYQRRLESELHDEILASRRLMSILQRLPAFSVLMLKYNNTFWRYLQQIIRGELTYPELPKKLGPLRHVIYRWADWEIANHRRDLDMPRPR